MPITVTPERKNAFRQAKTPRDAVANENQEAINIGVFIFLLAGVGYWATLLLNDFSSAGVGLGVNGASGLDSFVNLTFPQCWR